MKKKLFLLTILLISVLLIGCSSKSKLDLILEKDNYIVVDVRTKTEYDTGHVVGSINIPYDEIDSNVSLDKTKTILVYCKSGGRSSIAYDTLKSLGYDVYDLGAYSSVTLEKE